MEAISAETRRTETPRTTKPASEAGCVEYRYGDSNPGFRREGAAS